LVNILPPALYSRHHVVEWGWSIDVQREVFLIPLVERYPELAGLVTALRE
jgi:hypothetical protein